MRIRVRHTVLALLCAMYFISYIDRVNIAVAGLLIRSELGLTPTQLGLIFSAFAYPYAAMQILGGWLSDRYGPRRILSLLSTLWAAATIATGFAWSLPTLLLCRLGVGVGEGGAFPTATRAFTFWMPVRERGFAQGITHSFARLGGAVTPPIVLGIVALYGWREAFIVLGVVSLIWTGVWLMYYTNHPGDHPRITADELAEIGVSRRTAQRSTSESTPWGDLISKMWKVTFVDFCYGWSLWVFLTWLPSYLSEGRGFPLSQMAIMTMLPLMAGVVGDTLGGVISDRVYARSGNLRLARRAPLVVGLAGSFVFILPAVITESAVAAVWYLSLAFFFLELTNAVLWALPLDIATRHAGTAGGMMNTGFGVAGMISPLAFGYLIERTGNYQVPFFLSAALLLVGLIVAFWIDPTDRIQEPGVAISTDALSSAVGSA